MLRSGGPGRSFSQREEGMVKTNHQTPDIKRTIRKGRVDGALGKALDIMKRSRMLRIWTKTAAMYPIPTPLEEMVVESLSEGESDGLCLLF